jgi:hypothetical protein
MAKCGVERFRRSRRAFLKISSQPRRSIKPKNSRAGREFFEFAARQLIPTAKLSVTCGAPVPNRAGPGGSIEELCSSWKSVQTQRVHLLGDRGPIVISERTKAGMPAARRRGLHVGRPLKLDPKQLVYARRMIVAGGSRAGSRRRLVSIPRRCGGCS